MLDINNINEAISVTGQLEVVNITLSAIDNTPLHSLVQASTLVQDLNTDKDYIPNPEMISLNSGLGEDPHGALSVDLIDTISTYVNSHISFTKNKVKPIIEEIVKLTSDRFNAAVDSDLNSINIVPVDFPSIMHNSDFIDSLQRFEGIPFDPNDYTLAIVDLNETKVLDAIKTVYAELGTEIELMLASLPVGFLSKLVEVINSGNRLMPLIIDREYGLEYCILIHLFALALIEEPIEGIRMNLNSFNEIAHNLVRQTAFKINYYNEIKIKDDKSGKLINYYDNNIIKVNSFVYNKFKEEGGVDGIILGNVTSDMPRVYISDINLNRDKYLRNWEMQYSMQIHKTNQKIVVLKKSALREALFNAIEINSDKAFGHLITIPEMDYKQLPEYKQFVDLAFKFLDKLSADDFNNIWKLVTNLVCDCLFFYTDAKKILLGVERAKELNPDIQVREALLLSTIEYVTDYICSQIKMTT